MKTEAQLADFLLEEAYALTSLDEENIEQASFGHPEAEHWKKSCLKGFKEHVKDFYSDKQNNRCVYCRMKVSLATGFYHIEHIAPKSLYPQWMYEPKNLCLACPNCNSAKNATDILAKQINKNVLPFISGDYLIINPYLDKYFEHIEIINGLLYHGLTKKGTKTIAVCHLTRTDLLSERAENLIIKEQKKGSFERIMLTYAMHKESIADWDSLITNVQKTIEKLKE